MSKNMKRFTIIGAILIMLIFGLLFGRISGYEYGYAQGRQNVLGCVSTIEFHLSERIDQMVAEKSRSKKWHDQVIQRIKYRQSMVKRTELK